MTEKDSAHAPFSNQVLYYLIITISAVFIIFPGTRTLPFAKIVVSLVMFSLLFILIRNGMKSGALKLSLPKMYSQAKDGRRLVPVALEMATVVVANIAFWMTI
jgi:hypothetical protein